jgi:hypothetical protein
VLAPTLTLTLMDESLALYNERSIASLPAHPSRCFFSGYVAQKNAAQATKIFRFAFCCFLLLAETRGEEIIKKNFTMSQRANEKHLQNSRAEAKHKNKFSPHDDGEEEENQKMLLMKLAMLCKRPKVMTHFAQVQGLNVRDFQRRARQR